MPPENEPNTTQPEELQSVVPEGEGREEIDTISDQSIKNKNAYLILSVVGALVCIALLVYIFLRFFGANQEPSTAQINTGADERALEEIREEYRWSNQDLDSTAQNLDDYIASLTQKIEDPTTPLTAKKLLLLRKAGALGTVRSTGGFDATVAESADILRSLYESEPQNANEEYYKYASVYAYIKLLPASCYREFLGEKLPSPYNETYTRLLAEGFIEKKAAILAVLDFAYNGVNEYVANDRGLVTKRANIAAQYLLVYGGENPEIDSKVYQDLLKDVLRYDALISIVTQGAIQEAIAFSGYAIAYDLAYTFGATSILPETNAQIDKNYEDFYARIDEAEGDNVTKNILTGAHAIRHFSSLHRRYSEEELDQTVVDTTIDRIIDSILFNKDTKAMFAGYLLEARTDMGRWNTYREFFLVTAAEYPKLKEAIEELSGLEL